ncbi:BOX elements [hydrothermal vent metagenome]|uniref:BOX elements n=1 Tax=hydrothermal vent metagenome TaxID=652676 RepID=A0A1W1EDI6_9ZZZZ
MKILVADYIYVLGSYLQNRAIAFTDTIQAVDSLNNLKKQYPNAEIITCEENSVIYPGFINTHVHLEFSANKTSLKYGNFMPWLDTVIEHREDLVASCDNELMLNECNEMLNSGITTFGAISSFGTELEVCEKTPQRVVFFNELIGSNAQYADMLYGDFLERLSASKSCDDDSLITAGIAIHSPYSVHPIILQKAVNLAKQSSLPLCAHFLESQCEREWLDRGEGELKLFFEKYFKTSVPVTDIDEFIHAFDSYPTHFTHAVQTTSSELEYLASKGHSIAHCPRSNRYLGCGRLPIEVLRELDIKYSLATDGLSSNDSLNIFDELRAALMLHHQAPIQELSRKLIESITSDAADILGLECGKIEVGKLADFAIVKLKEKPKREEEIALWTIIHSKRVSAIYINGKKHV